MFMEFQSAEWWPLFPVLHHSYTYTFQFLYLVVRQLVGWSVSRPASQSVGRSVSQSVGRSVSQLVGQSVSWSVSHSVGRSVSQLVSQSVSHSVSHSVTQSVLRRVPAYVCACGFGVWGNCCLSVSCFSCFFSFIRNCVVRVFWGGYIFLFLSFCP